MKKAKIGYQVYSAREEASKDLRGVLGQLADMGYDGVEFAGFYGHSSDDVKKMLSETGLEPISSHAAIPSSKGELYAALAYHLEIGASYMAIPFLDEAHRPGSAGFAATICDIYEFGEAVKAAGMQLLYHNHDFEFIKLSEMYGLDFLYAAVPACLLKTEIDTCWVNYAGENPSDYIKKYAGRCPVIHLKDFVGSSGGGQPYALINKDGSDDGGNKATEFEFRPVGYGVQDIPDIVNAGLESGAEWFIVEQDLSVGRAPLEAAKLSRDYLVSIGQ